MSDTYDSPSPLVEVNVYGERGEYIGVVLPIGGAWHAGHDDEPGLGPRRATRDQAVEDVHHYATHGRFPD